MQAPGNLDLNMYQGANWDYELTWNTGGTPVNLTGYDARMQMRRSDDTALPVLSLSAGSGITLGGTAGTIYLETDAATTAGIDDGTFVYDLELIDGSGYVTRLVQGNIQVDAEVTR